MSKHLLVFAALSCAAVLQAQNIEHQIVASQYGEFQVPSVGNGYVFPPSACQVPAGGTNIDAFSPGTPIKIVDTQASQTEVVTPIAVFIHVCAVSLQTVYQHTSFYLTSGTGGLQEALTNGEVHGGANTVILDSQWYTLIQPRSAATVIATVQGSAALGLVDVTQTPYVYYAWNTATQQYVAQSSTGGSGSPTGAAGGALGGSYPNPSLGNATLQKLTQAINVQAPPYAAACDNATDDTAAIQAAINAAESTSNNAPRALIFPNGHCVVSSTLQINQQNVQFWGNGSLKIQDSSLSDSALVWKGGAAPMIQLGYPKNAAITSISCTAGVTTATFPAMAGGVIANGFLVDIAGVANISYDGTFTLTASSATSASWNQTCPGSSSSGGTISEDLQSADYQGLSANFQIHGMTLINGAPTTNLDNTCTYNVPHQYTPGSSAITDWHGGSIIGTDVTMIGFDYPFYGVASDLDQWNYLTLGSNHHGFWIGPRSDQMEIFGGNSGCNDTAFTIESAHNTTIRHFTTDSDGSNTDVPINIQANYPYGASGTKLVDDWFEAYHLGSSVPPAWISIVGNAGVGSVADHTYIEQPFFNTLGNQDYYVNIGPQAFDVYVDRPNRLGNGPIYFADGFINYSGTVTGSFLYLDPGVYNTLQAPVITNTSTGVLTYQTPLVYSDSVQVPFSFGASAGLAAGTQYGCFDNTRGCFGYSNVGGGTFLGSTTASTGWALKYQGSTAAGVGTTSLGGDSAGNIGVGPSSNITSDPFYVTSAGGVVAGSPTGGSEGAGTINVSGGYYVNGTAIGTGSGAVSSVFGRTGAVAAAAGDYSVSQVTGAAPLASPSFSGAVTAPAYVSTAATGTAPFTVSSTTTVANLSAASLSGATFAAPGAIGSVTPGSGAFTTLSATSGVSATADGVHAGYLSLVGNTANQAVAANTVGEMGPAVASFTAYAIQWPGVGPAVASIPCLAALAGAVSAESFCPVTGSGGTVVEAASPALTGTPTAPTATAGTNTTQIATTQFVTTAVAGAGFGTAATQNTGTSGATIPLNNGANTESGATTFSAAGAASTPGVTVSGAPYTGGTAATNFPQLYLNSGATAPTTFSTAGEAFGINAPSGFVGNLINAFVNGSSTKFRVDYAGDVFNAGYHTTAANGTASQAAFTLSGAPYTAGTATTNYPLFYLNDGAAPTTWSTAGTALGINAPSGFTGNFLDMHLNGGASLFALNSAGAASAPSFQGTTAVYATLFEPTGNGSTILKGGNSASSSAAGSVSLEAGANSSTGQQGFVSVQQSFTTAAALAATFEVVSMSTTADQVQASALGANNNVGVAQTVGGAGTQLYVVSHGKTTVRFDGTPVVGDVACYPPASTGTAGLAHDNGSTACTLGESLGVVTGQVSGTGSGATATVEVK